MQSDIGVVLWCVYVLQTLTLNSDMQDVFNGLTTPAVVIEKWYRVLARIVSRRV